MTKLRVKNTNRPALEELIGYVREDDIVVVHSMDRLARNLDDLRKIVKTLTSQNIQIKFLKENLIFAGDDSPMANLLLSVMGAFAEFERTLIKERQLKVLRWLKRKGFIKAGKLCLIKSRLLCCSQKLALVFQKLK